MTTAAVCVPWRPDNGPRVDAWTYVHNHLSALGLPVVTADSGHPRFNRAASRNTAANLAITAFGPDVLVFNDADTFLPPDQYPQLIDLAATHDAVALGADRLYLALNRKQTTVVLHGGCDPWDQPVRHPNRLRNSDNSWFPVGGVTAMTVDLYRRLGGYDQRFDGWGCEDTAIVKAARWVTGRRAVRCPGDMAQLWHPSAQHTANPANSTLWQRYGACTTRTHMLDLLAEPGGPLHQED